MTDDFNDFNNRLSLRGRKNLSVSGVEDVSAFDDKMIIALTNMGELNIKGEGMKILSLNTETGEMTVEGDDISSLVYIGTDSQRSFLKRLFK